MKITDKHILSYTYTNSMKHDFFYISFDTSSDFPFFIDVKKHLTIEQAQYLSEVINEMIKKGEKS